MSTLRQLLADIDTRLPNGIAQASKVRWLNNAQNEVWRWVASTEMYTFNTVSTDYLYTLTTNIRLDEIQAVRVSNSTVNDGTEDYFAYQFCGVDQPLVDCSWYTGMGEHQLGLYPLPDESGYRVQVTYRQYPAQLTTDLLDNALTIDEEYEELLATRCMEIIAKAGNAPDVGLGNNYEMDYKERLKSLKMDYYKKRQRQPNNPWDYTRGWYRG
jgi:hypothetical protein